MKPFLTAVFTGARFERKELPVEVLEELRTYRELVFEVARAEYLARHPDRERVPKGFGDSFSLTLSKIDGGSTSAVLNRRHRPNSQLTFDPDGDPFDVARDWIAEAIQAADSNRPSSRPLPPQALVLFRRFGRRLAAGDQVELRPASSDSGPVYSQRSRRKLMESLAEPIDIPYRSYVRFAGVHVDPKPSAAFKLVDGNEVTVASPPEPVMRTMLGCAPRYEDLWLQLVGTATVDSSGSVTAVSEVEDVEVVGESQSLVFDEIVERMHEIKLLGAGWTQDAKPMVGSSLDWVTETLLLIVGETADVRPGIYPTPDGNVQAEWVQADNDLTLLFDTLDRTVTIELLKGDHNEHEVVDGGDPAQVLTRVSQALRGLAH